MCLVLPELGERDEESGGDREDIGETWERPHGGPSSGEGDRDSHPHTTGD